MLNFCKRRTDLLISCQNSFWDQIFPHINITFSKSFAVQTQNFRILKHKSTSEQNPENNKKVLLRERKRHTACRVASTPYVVLTGYPPSHGTPPARVPPRLPHGILGNVAKHYGIWVPPPGCPMAFWEMLQSIMGYGYPPGVNKLTKWNYYLPVVLRTRAVKIQAGWRDKDWYCWRHWQKWQIRTFKPAVLT